MMYPVYKALHDQCVSDGGSVLRMVALAGLVQEFWALAQKSVIEKASK